MITLISPSDLLPDDVMIPACTDAPEHFFSEDPHELEQAKVVCRVCPMRQACLAGALERREPWGVWGGALLDRGRVIAYKRAPRRMAGSAA
jgi:WhiB family redox-sensing transcriptional regulator